MNKYERRSKQNYDKKAENYDETFDGRFTVKFKKIMYENVKIDEKQTVADIACGNGSMLRRLAEGRQFDGYGVDISEKMIEEARRRNPDMQFYVAGCDRLPFAKEQIDVMTVCAAYHHFPDVAQFAREAERVIKKGGRLYVAEVYLPTALRVLCNPFVRFSKAGDVKFYGAAEISRLFEKNGFETKNVLVDGRVQLIELQKNN